MTLEELKKRNAEKESASNETEKEEEAEKVENVDQDESQKVESEKEGQQEDEAEESENEEALEAWQQSEESEDSQDGKAGFVPNAGAKKLRLKAKAFRDERDEAQSELEKLRQELEQVKSGQFQQPHQPQELKRPRLEDFDFDEEAHGKALDDYYDKRAELKQSQFSQKSQQAQAIQAQQQARENAVNKHYQAAERLIQGHGIDEKKYQDADGLIRSTAESVMPNQGDAVVDSLIANLVNIGEGSEKVMYYLGNNASELARFRSTLKDDPSGLQTSIFLGRLLEKATKPIREKSNAPKPQKQLKGDSSVTSSTYKKWSKSTDISERVRLKREAAKAGEDVSKW